MGVPPIPPIVPILGINDLVARGVQSLLQRGGFSQARSAARSSSAYSDSTAGEFSEAWADLTGWSTNTGIQVSGGKLYSNSGTGVTGGINHPWVLAANDTGRATFVFNYVQQASSGGVIIGVSNDAAGAVPATGGTSARGLFFRPVDVQAWGNPTTTITSPTGTPTTGTYLVTITVDAINISVVAASITPSNSVSWRAKFLRSAFPTINNIYILNTDTRNLTGSNISTVATRKRIATSSPSLHIESQGRTIQWSSLSGNNFKVVLPANYDSRVPAPVVIMFHGNGSDENLFSDNGPSTPSYTALSNAGYILLSAAYTPATSTWGAQASLDAYTDAYRYLIENYAIGPVVLYGESMGGIESLLVLAESRIPNIVAWVGRSPTYSLLNNYTANFTTEIKAAYGIDPDGSDYAAKTTGHDPGLMIPTAFRGAPMMILSASDDTIVSKTANGDALAAKVTGMAMEVINVAGITGGHQFSLTPYTAAVTAFCDKYARA